MTEPSPVTLAFIETHPDKVAEEISRLDPSAAVPFLDDVPVEDAARVLSLAPPWYGARVIAEVDAVLAAKLLRAMAVSDATPILRLVTDESLDRILEQLPKRAAATFRNALNFPSWSVGAWMDRKILVLGADTAAVDAVDAFRRQKNDVGMHCTVVDADGAFLGVIDLAQLLRMKDSVRLDEVADRQITPIYGRSRLVAVAALADWDRYDALPILGRKGNPIGQLRRAVVRLALESGHQESVAPEPSLLLGVAESYARTVPALLAAFLAAPGGEPPKI